MTKATEAQVREVVEVLKKNKDEGHNAEIGTMAKNSRYGGYSDKTKKLEMYYWPCHRHMNSIVQCTVSFSQIFRTKLTGFEEATQAYFDWLTDPVDSPWLKHVLPSEPYILDDVNLHSKEFMLEYGWVFPNTDTLPSNVQHQFLVATRVAKEWPYLVKAWHNLVKNYGFTKEWAFAFVSMWYVCPGDNHKNYFQDFEKCQEIRLFGDNFYDFPLDMNTCNPEYVLNFLEHIQAGKKNVPYYESPSYTPVNSIWDDSNLDNYNSWSGPVYKSTIADVKKRYVSYIRETYSSTAKSFKDFSGSLGRQHKQEPFWTFEQVVEIGLKEQARLYRLIEERNETPKKKVA